MEEIRKNTSGRIPNVFILRLRSEGRLDSHGKTGSPNEKILALIMHAGLDSQLSRNEGRQHDTSEKSCGTAMAQENRRHIERLGD